MLACILSAMLKVNTHSNETLINFPPTDSRCSTTWSFVGAGKHDFVAHFAMPDDKRGI